MATLTKENEAKEFGWLEPMYATLLVPAEDEMACPGLST